MSADEHIRDLQGKAILARDKARFHATRAEFHTLRAEHLLKEAELCDSTIEVIRDLMNMGRISIPEPPPEI